MGKNCVSLEWNTENSWITAKVQFTVHRWNNNTKNKKIVSRYVTLTTRQEQNYETHMIPLFQRRDSLVCLAAY